MPIRILVVEDVREWRKALRGLYEGILKGDCEIVLAEDVDDAERELNRDSKFDILSLDINLGEGVHPGRDGKKVDCNGMDILFEAARRKLVNGVVVITLAPHDQELPAVVEDADELREVRMTLPAIVEHFFPARNRVLYKHPDVSVEESLKLYRRGLTPAFLKKLAVSAGEMQGTVTLQFDGDPGRGISTIAKISQKRFRIHNRSDALFFYALAVCKQCRNAQDPSDPLPGGVTKRGVLKTYRLDLPPDADKKTVTALCDDTITDLRRRLDALGLPWRRVFRAVRGLGYELLGEVKVVGLASVNAQPIRSADAPDADDLVDSNYDFYQEIDGRIE